MVFAVTLKFMTRYFSQKKDVMNLRRQDWRRGKEEREAERREREGKL